MWRAKSDSGWLQAQVAVNNLGHLIEGTEMESYVPETPGIYLSLGIVSLRVHVCVVEAGDYGDLQELSMRSHFGWR